MYRTTSALGHLPMRLLKVNQVLHEDDIVLQDTLQVSLEEQKSHKELEAKQNVEKVKEQLMAEEIKKSDKESLEVENIAEISQPINVIEKEEELAEDDYELKLREKGKHVGDIRHTPSPTTIRSPRIQSTLVSLDTKKLNTKNFQSEISSQVNDAITNHIPSQVDSSVSSYMSGHVLHVHPTQATPTNAQEQQHQLYLTMKDNPQLQQDDLPIWLALKYKFERLHIATTPCRPSAICPRDQDDSHDDAHPEGENSVKRQKKFEHGTFVFRESSSGQDYESEPDDDVLPNEKVSQELMDEMSQTVDEAKLSKIVDEMLRQPCMSGDEHQYHIDQMQNFLKSDIVWESRKEIIVPPYQPKPTSVVQSCKIDPKAPALSLVNQDLLYLKKGNTGPEKIALSLHKFPAVKFPELDCKNLNKNDIEDKYLLIINHKVDDYAKTGLSWSLSVFIRSTLIWERVHDSQLGVESYQQQVNLSAPTITFLGIEKYKVFSIVFEPVYDIIYKNSKKEKRVMRHQEVHKFCDATLKRVLEGLKSYNNNVKYGYVTHNLSKEDVEYLQLFAEEIEEWLKYHDQMKRWEMYVNGRPLGSRRERPE
ncbi:hypothetical protein Tco_1002178 [Tanacetum coccineum]|uniref:Uncharacterized protein n=1 Tax=Tanacetum coccineum TaxID=301880 RepID=A0ABQ5F5S7_9ASTR